MQKKKKKLFFGGKKKKKNIYLSLKVQEISFHISNKKIQKARPPGLNAKKKKKQKKQKKGHLDHCSNF